MGGSSESDGGVSELIALRQLLSCSMDEAEELAAGLERSHIRLQGLGSRLPALRACIAPLQARSEQALGVGSRIDQAMSSACAVVERFEQLRRLEKAIQVSDPQADIGGYLLAVSQLEEGLRFLVSNWAPTMRRLREAVDFMAGDARYSSRMQRMSDSLKAIEDDWQQQQQQQLVALEGGAMEIAVKKLEQEFQRLLEEAGRAAAMPLPSRLAPHPKKNEREVVELPLAIHVVQQLRTIAKRMASIGAGQVERCVRVFVEQRSAKVRESLLELKADYLVQLHLRSVKGVDMSEWWMLEKLIGEWSAHMEVVVKLVYMGERRLCHKLFAGLLPDWSECLARVAQPGMTLFLQFGESVARSRRAPEKLFKLLDMFETLQNLGPSIAQVFQGCTHIRLRVRELQKLIVDGACGVFWEFGRQVASQGSTASPPPLPPQDAAVHKLTSYAVNYVKYLVCEFYSPIMEQVLKIEESWKRRRSKGEADKEEEEEQKEAATLLLERAVVRIMESLESAIDGQSKWYTEPIHHRIFLMNNAYYMFKRIKGSELGALLGDAWLKHRRARVQQHALSYQMEGWGKVLGQLSRDGLLLSSSSSSSSRATAAASRDLVRQRLEAFSGSMEEICDKHRHVVIPDPELRDATCLAVVQNIVPAYRSYLQSYGPFIDTRFIKYSADNVEQMLGNLFQ